MKNKRKNFNYLKNNRGNVTLLGASLTSILSLFLLFLILKMQIEYREAQYRKNSYLCMKYLVSKTDSYVSQMTKLNWALRTAYAAQFTGTGTEEAILIFKNLVILRNAIHVSYLKNLFKNRYCSFPESSYFVKNLPYQTKDMFVLETTFDETTKVRANSWKNIITITPNKIRATHLFSLEVEFSINGPFVPNLKYSSKEVGKKDLLSLNRLFGSQS